MTVREAQAIAGALGLSVPLIWALVFGALISPTDPVAVLAALTDGRAVDDLIRIRARHRA